MSRSGRLGKAAASVPLVVLAVLATACTKSQSDGSSSSAGNASGGQQVVATGSNAGPACTYTTYGAPKVDLSTATVGFSQSESTSNPFRATETQSITAEAQRLGVKLIQRNANADVNAQNSQIEDMIAQGAQVLIVAPENSDGLGPALAQAKAKHIPVLTIDRTAAGTACSDFIGFLGSDFYHQAQIAADDLIGATGGKANVAMLLGTSGNNVTTDRTKGFQDEIKAKGSGLTVVAQQTANFDQTTGQSVMEQLLQSNPNINAVYAENDEMALGAIQAIRAAGKTPGQDIKVVSIDGTQQAVQDVAQGLMVADVETNPRFGPLAFQALKDFYSDKGTSTKVVIQDHHYTKDNAQQSLSSGTVY
jgi:ribose transport system substrate-binding protein